MKRRRSNTLVALSSAAVMTVYAAGFMRTRAAAAQFEHASRERIPVIPAPAPAPITETSMVAKAPKVVAPKAATIAEPQPAKHAVQPAATAKPVGVDAAVAVAETAVTPATPTPTLTTPTAPTPVTAPLAPPVSPSAEILLGGTELRDGTYLGWGTSRHGDIQASVTILSGRITAVSIAQCRTRYSCDVIAHLPAKVMKDQTPEKLNNVSGATQSVDAFYYAVVDAMNKAK